MSTGDTTRDDRNCFVKPTTVAGRSRHVTSADNHDITIVSSTVENAATQEMTYCTVKGDEVVDQSKTKL